MTAKRMTGKDYKKELQELNNKERSLKALTSRRLLELVTKYPNVDLPTSRAGGLKCNNIASKFLIDDFNIESIILYIEAIEKYLADKHSHKQTTIDFSDRECISEKSLDGKHLYKNNSIYCSYCGFNKNYF